MTRRTYLAGDDVVVTRLPRDIHPDRVVETLIEVAAGNPGRDPDPPDPLPPGAADNHGFVLIAHVTETNAPRLEHIVERLAGRIRRPEPLLVAIAENDKAAREVADAFASTLLVRPDMEARIDDLIPFLPGLFENISHLGTVGSVRLPRPIDISDVSRRDQALVRALTRRKGVPLHRVAGEPFWEHYSFAAPGRYHDPIREAIEAHHLASHATSAPVIQVAGFIFENEQEPTAVEMNDHDGDDDRNHRRPRPPGFEG